MMIREMVMHHLRDVEGVDARVEGARQFLQLYIDNAPDNEATASTVKAYCRSMLERDPRVLFHDELGPVFKPFYLHEFADQAEEHGLQFVAESEGLWWREELFPSSRGKAVAAAIGPDPLQLHQYLDFFTARLFRQSIVRHGERALDRTVDYRRVRSLWAAGRAIPTEAEFDISSKAPLRFELNPGVAIAIDDPRLKAALFKIGQAWPRAVAIAELPDHPDVDEGLLQLFTAGHLVLMAGSTPAAGVAGDLPIASPLARLQASKGRSLLCSLDHNLVSFEDQPSRDFLALLDGRHTRDALVEALMQDGRDRAAAAELMEAQLTGLARLGLLVG
jgi:hypothetical protein